MQHLYPLLLCLLATGLTAQNCTTGSVTLGSQTAVDDFVSLYAACTTIRVNGDLSIGGETISDLSGLANIRYVSGNLRLNSLPALTNLNGLQNIDSTGGNISLFLVPLITDLSGLSGLKKVGVLPITLGQLSVSDCNGLTSLNGLQGLTQVFRLSINGNASLHNLAGLSNLVEVEDLLSFGQSAGSTSGLQNLVGLSSLRRVGRISINGLASLLDFSGLDSFEEVTGAVDINGVVSPGFSISGFTRPFTVGGVFGMNSNPGLESINLQMLTASGRIECITNTALDEVVLPANLTVEERIIVAGNPILLRIAGLENLVVTADEQGNAVVTLSSNLMLSDIDDLGGNPSLTAIFITDNPQLATCAVPLVCDHLAAGGAVSISGNTTGCSSAAEVEAACLALPVEWGEFTATSIQDGIELRWTTRYEANNEGFYIEHSQNGRQFEVIGFTPGENTNSGAQYQFYHRVSSHGKHYYRLRQRDWDGRETNSTIVQVGRIGQDTQGLLAYPSVVETQLTIDCPYENTWAYLYHGTSGATIFRQRLPTGLHVIATHAWPPGMYVLRTTQGDYVKLIKH